MINYYINNDETNKKFYENIMSFEIIPLVIAEALITKINIFLQKFYYSLFLYRDYDLSNNPFYYYKIYYKNEQISRCDDDYLCAALECLYYLEKQLS